jgi:hypothetical protein
MKTACGGNKVLFSCLAMPTWVQALEISYIVDCGQRCIKKNRTVDRKSCHRPYCSKGEQLAKFSIK